jgi:hypothetical protein
MFVAFVALPFVLPVILRSKLFGRGANLTKEEITSYIRSALDPIDGGRWDEFTQTPLRDAELEAIRVQVSNVRFPLRSLTEKCFEVT